MGKLLGLSDLAVYVNPADDPILEAANNDPSATAAKEEEELSECENHNIKPTDNLIVIGHVEQEYEIPAFTLEVYGQFYGLQVYGCLLLFMIRGNILPFLKYFNLSFRDKRYQRN